MNKLKYVLAKTGEEVNFGDILYCTKEKKTSFGTIKTSGSCLLTPYNVDVFIEKGIIEVRKSLEVDSKDTDNIGFYLEMLSKRIKCSVKELTSWLENMNKVCPKAVLDMLLQEIALAFYNNNPEAFDKAKEYYSLRPRDGKVGKVININSYIPLFKSKEDAEKARNILKGQLALMYGK